MDSFHVTSKIIESVYFSQGDGTLRIVFRNGEERLFVGVPEGEVAAMCKANSPGRHYIEHIRTRFKRLAT